MKPARVKKLAPERTLGENAARIVRTRLEELRAFAPRAVGQGEQAALGCRIRLAIGLGLQGAGRGYVDDAAPSLAQAR